MALEITLVVLGAAALLLALVGCVLPILPGPIIGWVSLLLIFFAGGAELISVPLLAGMAALALAATVTDQILPAAASKQAGAGRAGVIGSVVGMILGMIFFPPFGLIVGAFLGALLGEVVFHKENEHPFRSAFAVLRGTLLATVVKLAVTGVFAVVFVQRAISLFG